MVIAAVAALAGAGVLAAVVPAGSAQSTTTTETSTTGSTTATTVETTTTATTSTTTTTTTTTPPPKPRPRPRPQTRTLPVGVTIGGIHVGGLSPNAAYAVVRAAFRAPLVLQAGGHRALVSPSDLGAVAYAKAAVAHARSAPAGSAVALGVNVHGAAVRKLVAELAKRYDREPIEPRLFLRHLQPYITKGAPGKALDQKGAVAAILRALRENRRTGIVLPYEDVAQKLTRARFGPVIVIRRGANHLYLYRGMKPWRTFVVATGQSVYPTPLGRFQIVVKWKDPWWYPPDSPWAKGAKPIPPGPGNPLGTRWMGLTAPGVGIHGTPDAASLGYSASHGCIRMYIPQAEWLFDHVDIGTPVYIVPA
ncbi:MAG TPA: L,D-transpeptidase family protein [Gaiellaceae bacterium]|nr:L,D-transpeptidase family protein [Gaiellaceae bacterium]